MNTKKYLWVFIAILAFAVDRISKALILHYLLIEEVVNVFPMFNLFLTFNPGAAFSLLKYAGGWQEWLFGGVAIGVSIAIVIWQTKISEDEVWLKIALALIIGGTLGNLYDRIVYYQVIDFLDFYFKDWHYPTFNIADSVICIGAVMLLIDNMRKKAETKV